LFFCAAAKDLDHALDFVHASNHRIEFALLGQFGQIATEGAQRRRLHVLLRRTFSSARGFLLGFRRRKVRVELLKNFVSRPLDIDFEALQDASRDAFTFTQ